MSENEFWVKCWKVIASGAVAVALLILAHATFTNYLFVQGGYHSCVLPGSNSAQWCK